MVSLPRNLMSACGPKPRPGDKPEQARPPDLAAALRLGRPISDFDYLKVNQGGASDGGGSQLVRGFGFGSDGEPHKLAAPL